MHFVMRLRVSGFRIRWKSYGFTIIELVVAFTIVAILISLIVPAIQHSRSVSSRLHCSANLKQIGLANHSFAESNGVFPTVQPAYWRLLPFLEQRDVAMQLMAGEFPRLGVNVFICPSDVMGDVSLGNYSYHLNDGTRFRTFERNGFLDFPADRRPCDIRDGLSCTAAYSERLIMKASAATSVSEPTRYFWYVPNQIVGDSIEDQFVVSCRTQATSQNPAFWIWNNPSLAGPAFGGYDHLMPPNSRSCVNGPYGNVDIDNSAVAANSAHINGVNLLYADGRAVFVSQSIDLKVWRAIGTRRGAETVNAP